MQQLHVSVFKLVSVFQFLVFKHIASSYILILFPFIEIHGMVVTQSIFNLYCPKSRNQTPMLLC